MALEKSILKSVRTIVNVGPDDSSFDLDILTNINSAFSSLAQLGVGPEGGFFIEDETAEWSQLGIPPIQLAMVRTYINLKVRMLFDPPTTSFLIDATNKQILEQEWRLNVMREPPPEEAA